MSIMFSISLVPGRRSAWSCIKSCANPLGRGQRPKRNDKANEADGKMIPFDYPTSPRPSRHNRPSCVRRTSLPTP